MRTPLLPTRVMAAFLAAAVGLASGSPRARDLSATVVAILSDSTGGDALERLAALPKDAVPVLFGLLETGHLPAAPDVADGAPRLMTEGQEAAVLAGLRALGLDAVRACVAGRLKADPAIATRVAALRALGAVGGAGELALAVSAATPGADGEGPFPRVTEELEAAAEEIFRRDARAVRSADFVIRSTPPALRHHLAQAVGATGSERGIEPLSNLLGDDPRFDVVLLTQIARLGREAQSLVDDAALRNVREYLWSDDDQLLREAAHAAGALEDWDAMERLVELVGDPREPIRESAHWALCRMTGLALRADARLWRSWYASESEWYREEAPRLIANLRGEEAGEVVKALSELAQHRLHRRRIATEIEALLRDEREDVRRLAIRSLERIRRR